MSLYCVHIYTCSATSNINGVTYFPWVDSDLAELRKISAVAQDFDDPNGLLKLSDKQRPHFHSWFRPFDLSDSPRMIHLISSFSIKQVMFLVVFVFEFMCCIL